MKVNTIYNESNLQTTRAMPDGFLDMVLTSPPYDDLRSYNGYQWDFEALVYELFRTLKPGGVVVWVVNDKTTDGDESGTSFKQALFFKSVGFKLWDTMIFAKKNCFPGDVGKRYKQMFEFMFVFVKGKEPKTFNPIQVPTTFAGTTFNAARLERDGRNYLTERSGYITVAETKNAGNIFTYATGFAVGLKQDLGAFKHPAVFPEELARDQILSWSNEGDLVYDPFMGSGTTAKAAHLLNRRWIGSEISAEYVELANKRLKPYLMQEALF
jgi:DNA modification methylase